MQFIRRKHVFTQSALWEKLDEFVRQMGECVKLTNSAILMDENLSPQPFLWKWPWEKTKRHHPAG